MREKAEAEWRPASPMREIPVKQEDVVYGIPQAVKTKELEGGVIEILDSDGERMDVDSGGPKQTIGECQLNRGQTKINNPGRSASWARYQGRESGGLGPG